MADLTLDVALSRRKAPHQTAVKELRGAIGNGNNQYTQDNPTKGRSYTRGELEDAVQNYTADISINQRLRNGRPLGAYARDVKVLDAAFKNAPKLEKDTVFYRAVEEQFVPEGPFADKGYISTSEREDVLSLNDDEGFITGDDWVRLEVIAPKGTPYIRVNDVQANEKNYFSYQKEVILPRGMTGTITGRTLRLDPPKLRGAIGNGNNQYKQDNPTKADRESDTFDPFKTAKYLSKDASGKYQVTPMKKWASGAKPGNGGEHLDHVYIDLFDKTQDGPLLKAINVTIGDQTIEHILPGRELREAGERVIFRDIHPDEPHSGRDEHWVESYANTGGGKMIDESPENPPVPKAAFKFWATPGTAKAEDAGSNPQHSVIRDAADRRFGLPKQEPDELVTHRLSDDKADKLAKVMIRGIEAAPPSQPTLWRGVSGEHGLAIKNSNLGDDIQFTLGSTSRDATRAIVYGGTEKDSVIMRILPGARGLAVRDYISSDQEVVTGGTFRVVGKSVSKKTGLTVVDVEQTEVFKWR